MPGAAPAQRKSPRKAAVLQELQWLISFGSPFIERNGGSEWDSSSPRIAEQHSGGQWSGARGQGRTDWMIRRSLDRRDRKEVLGSRSSLTPGPLTTDPFHQLDLTANDTIGWMNATNNSCFCDRLLCWGGLCTGQTPNDI